MFNILLLFTQQLRVQCTFITMERGNLAKLATSKWTNLTICCIAPHVGSITITQGPMLEYQR